MTQVSFVIPYDTQPGQNLLVVGEDSALGNSNPTQGFRLTFTAPNLWTGTVKISKPQLEYKYVLDHHGSHGYEFGDNRVVDLSGHSTVELRDYWRPYGDPQNALYTSFFMQGMC